MELSTVIGLVGALGAVIITLFIEGGSLISFINLGALVLILGGSIAVGAISFGINEVVSIPRFILRTIFPRSHNAGDLIISFISFSEKARREGLLSLEEDLKDIEDDTIRLGMQLVIDGTDPELVRSILESLTTSIEEEEKIPALLFETLGGFSPTLGIIGTVMGLVHVLEGLGGANMETLGRGIAVAFIATFYGIGFANLFWLPLSNKIKYLNKGLVERHEIIISGILSIQNGENPRIVKEKLVSHIAEASVRRKINDIAATD